MKKRSWARLLPALAMALACAAACGAAAEKAENKVYPVSASELTEMLHAPDSAALVGEIISVTGSFGGVFAEDMKDLYCLLVLGNPGSCCAESIRFIPGAACKEFPRPNTPVTLTGTLKKTELNGYSGLRIVDADLTWK